MSPTDQPPNSPQPGPESPTSFRTMFRVALLVIALGLAGLYAFAMINPSQTLEVRVVNKTGGAVKGLKVNEVALNDLADGETAAANLPLTPSVSLDLTVDDAPRRAEYPYEIQPGRRHQMTVNLVKNKDGGTEGRSTDTKFSVMFGSETTIVEPIDDMDMVVERIDIEHGPRTSSGAMTAPEMAPASQTLEEVKPDPAPDPAPEPSAEPDAPKAP